MKYLQMKFNSTKMTIEKLKIYSWPFKCESHVASFAALFGLLQCCQHMSPSNNNVVILRLLVATMLLYYNNGKL